MTKRNLKCSIVILTAVVLAGCSHGPSPLLNDIESLKIQNTELTAKVNSLQASNAQLSDQINTLSALDKKTRLETLDTLQQIKIGKRTGLYDNDNDSVNETLTVYLEPTDTAQDFVKAVGTAHIELWNLNAKSESARLADWSLAPADLHKLWGGNIFAGYYRIPLPVTSTLSGQEKELIIKVNFIDSLTGKTLSDNKTITP